MSTQVSNGLEVEEGRTYLRTGHKDGRLSFISPASGPNTYAQVGNQILEAKLELPTMEQTASLVHVAWQNPEEKYSKDIINKLKNSWLWAFNGLLYIPQVGVYIQDRPKIEGGKAVMDRSELVKKLEANDPSVRFVPFGFKREYQTAMELEKNHFVQALAGEEGAEKLAEIVDKYKKHPYVYAFDSNDINEPTIRVAALGSGWDFGVRLDVVGFNRSDGRGGYAFGVSRKETGEAGSKK